MSLNLHDQLRHNKLRYLTIKRYEVGKIPACSSDSVRSASQVSGR